jgi:hypothetical protein
MLERGFLATTGFYAMYAHSNVHVVEYLEAVREVFALVSEAMKSDSLVARLKGPLAHAGFRRLT